jgi:flavin reductase (DIM6/NTAB) family NADH-FMN oxidoreductase RutF
MSDTYDLLRALTSPIVAITTRRGDELNGMIVNSAMRASLSAEKPHVSAYVHKFNYSHDTIFETGRMVLHVLHREQMEVVYSLGFRSRREHDKMAEIPYREGLHGLPILDDCYASFECDVVNVMDTGASTLFLGAVRRAHRGPGTALMTAEYLRSALPEARRKEYERNLKQAQEFATTMADQIKAVVWRGLPV